MMWSQAIKMFKLVLMFAKLLSANRLYVKKHFDGFLKVLQILSIRQAKPTFMPLSGGQAIKREILASLRWRKLYLTSVRCV